MVSNNIKVKAYFEKHLINSIVTGIGRCSNMVEVTFADKRKTEYVLHVQCACRFIESEKVVLGGNDMYIPSKELSSDNNFDWDSFDWDCFGVNLYDEVSKELNAKENFSVESYTINQNNDLTIRFNNGIIFSTFTNNSANEEQWRFFESNSKKKHVVVYSNTIELE